MNTSTNPSSFVFNATEIDFQQTVMQASTQTPVLVDFLAPWCAPCGQLAPILETIAEQYQGKLLVAKVNSDEQMQLAGLFGVRSLPTVILIKNGQPVDGFMGVQPESVILKWLLPHVGEPPVLQQTQEEINQLPLMERITALRQELHHNTEPGEQLLDLADLLIQAEDISAAAEIMRTLTTQLINHDKAKRINAHLKFLEAMSRAPRPEILKENIQRDSQDLQSRYQLGVHHLLCQNAAAAVEEFLTIMSMSRKFDDDLGRRALIDAFYLIEDQDLISQTRRRMSALIF